MSKDNSEKQSGEIDHDALGTVDDRETSTGFTPAPWEAERINDVEWAITAGEWKICEVAGHCGAHDFDNNDESDANARLIAAAPALYAALQMAERVWASVLANRNGGEPKDQREPVLNAMRAALSLVEKPVTESALRGNAST